MNVVSPPPSQERVKYNPGSTDDQPQQDIKKYNSPTEVPKYSSPPQQKHCYSPDKYNSSSVAGVTAAETAQQQQRNSTDDPRNSLTSPHPAVMPLDVQLTEGSQPIAAVNSNSCMQSAEATKEQQEQNNDKMTDDEEEEDVKDGILESYSRLSGEVKKELLDAKREEDGEEDEELEDDEAEEDPRVSKLKALVEEVNDASLIWKVVRSRILSQCQVWDLLMDKACFRYYNELVASNCNGEEAAADQKPSVQPPAASRAKKFRSVLAEMEVLLGEFKCLMDGCLHAFNNQQEGSSTEIDDITRKGGAVPAVPADVISISPELSRAYDQSRDQRWKVKAQAEVNSLYQHFFTDSERDRKEATEMMFHSNQWSNFEDDDADDSYEVLAMLIKLFT